MMIPAPTLPYQLKVGYDAVMKFLLLICLFAVPLLAQTDLPDRGEIADLKGMSKVYVVANAEHFKMVKKELAKSFTLVNKADEADFFLEYKILSTKYDQQLKLESETCQLDAYLFRDKRKVVAWSESTFDGVFSTATQSLTKKFKKAFAKM